MASNSPDELTLQIMRHLEVDAQWVRHFDPTDLVGIAESRAAGRRAGRALKLKVVTVESDSAAREDGRGVVVVAVNQKMAPEDDARLDERARLLMDEAFKGLGGP
ncbi:hypothetical protein [Amycolatopsis antarctica]|uniref:hypothetical protein n=1 Tax=Amycolatopsis antarctica TaxID=1854586 RepID=UPI001055B01E|nr:hypothetical protein [Amycolatopsis antarctica]